MENRGMAFVAEESCWEWEPQHGFELTRRILAAHPQTRGVLCLNDRLAFGAYQALAEAGRRIPDDVAVLGFDNDEIAAYMRPGLTTLALPHEEMGRRAVELLLGDAEPATTHLVEMPVIVRQSLRGA
jgi:LacI family transcriptional regulator